jgi:glycosyltransferase involved in cell wall biosynthesis
MKVSLVLATVGRAEEVGRFVASLGGQLDQNFELIVVDQNSDDRLAPHIAGARTLGIAVQHCRMSRRNLSGARNLGLSKASGEVIAFPDDDCWYEPTTIQTVRVAFEAHADWSGIVANWVEQSAGQAKPRSNGLLSQQDWRRYRGGDASSICLFLRATLFAKIGNFDERLGVGQWFGAGEEVDLIFRALAARLVLARCGEVPVHHRFSVGKAAQAGITFAAMKRRARGTGALYAKHGLPLPVVLRGLLAPPFMALLRWRGLVGIKLGLAMSLGRIQGALQWLRTQGR